MTPTPLVGTSPGTLSTPVDAVVLAGGRGRRMGGDKAMVEVDGEPLVVRVVHRLAALGGDVVVARGELPPPAVRWRGVAPRLVPDVAGLAGPVAGLVAGLAAARTDVVAVVAVDHADVDADVLAAAAARLRGLRAAGRSADVVVPARRAWLHAAWARDVVARARTGRARGTTAPGSRGLSLRELLADLVVHDLDLSAGAWARDLDTPEDLVRRTEDGSSSGFRPPGAGPGREPGRSRT